MADSGIFFVFFLYGLAFFNMGLMVLMEMSRASDARLRKALRPLAAFGLLHGVHEWSEMTALLQLLPGQSLAWPLWEGARLGLMAFSFLSLAAFGASLLAPTENIRRLSLLVPLVQAGLWGIGLLVMRGQYAPLSRAVWAVADVWTRYVLAIPAALLASVGLVAQQRAFRRAGLSRFGRDSLWAAVAFFWYGLVGQAFTRASPLPPSTFLNQELFFRLFGFPVQLLRAGAAVMAATFVIRFLRAFEVETQNRIAELQAARLEEAERREAQRGELLRRVVAAQEAERQRVARELHDATGQSLTALGLGLRSLAGLVRDDAAAAERRLGHLEDLTARSLDELRRLIGDLRPSHLDDLGLAAALRWYAKDVQAHTHLPVSMEVSGEEHRLSSAVKIALFRVAQEAITNVIKHSGAQAARMRLAYTPEQVQLCVEDDGCGFDVQNQIALARPAWGLLGMRERAALLNGHCQVHSRPGQGTRVEVVIPYESREGVV
jgi:signal transduction histidine kinase